MLALALALLVPATAAAGYTVVLTALGWRRPARPAPTFTPLVTVVIPAHDEEWTLAAAVESVWASDYPADTVRVLVVADNCTDGTAAAARRAGADVLERHDPANRGKGFALAAGLPAALADGAEAVLVLDADCVLGRSALRHLTAALAGAEAVQAAVRPRNPDGGPGGLAAAVGWAVDDGVDAGRSAAGLGVTLRGTGMMFARRLVERVPWAGFGLAEDAEYTARLRRAGVRVRFVSRAVVGGEVPPDRAALATQRKRWRAALFSGGCGPVERLLASKPLVLAHLLLTVGVVAGLSPWLPAWAPLWAGGLLLATAGVYLRAMAVAGVRPTPGEVVRVTGVVGRLAWLTVVGRAGTWVRTARAAQV